MRPSADIARARVAAALLLVAVTALAAVAGRAGLGWVNRPFPGFFLLENRVVASISLPAWPVTRSPEVFQATVVAVDGAPVASTREVYEHVRRRPLGARVAYTLESRDGRFVRALPTALFGWRDAVLIFGVYFFNGVIFAVIGIGIWALSPGRATTWALLALGLCCSTYVLTAIDLYGPHALFRLHALAESFMGAVLVHLGLVFPVRRTTAWRAAGLCYLPAALLALVYQLRLDSPALYPGVHEVASLCIAGGGLFLLGSGVHGYLRTPSELVRHRVRFVVLGLLAGFVTPLAVITASLLDGGRAPVNAAAYTLFVVPLSVAYAVHKRDLFEIDALVQRGILYAILSGLVSAVYLLLGALVTQVLHLSWLGHSTAFPLVFTLAVLLVLPQLRERVQRLVDVVFGRERYDAREVLAEASTVLGATLDLDAILRLTLEFPTRVLRLDGAAVYLRTTDGFVRVAGTPGTEQAASRLADGRPLAGLLAALPRVVIRDSITGEAADRAAALGDFDALRAELIVPLECQGALTGFVVVGRKQAGTFFTADDVSFLRTFANQAALSLQNARTFHDLELLNADLERRVDDRTRQLAASKDRLAASLDQLGSAYRTLQASQEQLIAAQKMAAFGRLAAGIAHEVNTPLGAALNGLKVARELIAECEALAAAGDADPEDRAAAFAELATLVANVEDWTRKAVAYIRSVKSHGRSAEGCAVAIDVGRLLTREIAPLVMHRLRLAGGDLTFDVAPELPELFGDSTRLGQVLLNLVNNAIDASEGLPPERARIRIEATTEDGEVMIRVHDRGSGVAAAAREQIFAEFYTTKPPGRGTGLGLSIARDIVTAEFGGTLACTASGPDGSTFTMRLPVRATSAPRAPRSTEEPATEVAETDAPPTAAAA
jgi:signal transduction histidine kinase